jgi:hypothetical protein
MKQKINSKLLDYCYNNSKENYICYLNKTYTISEIPEYGEIELYNFITNDIIHHIIIKDKRLDFISRNKYLYVINLYLLLRNFYEEETK